MGKLKDTVLRSIKATGKARKLSDGQGLYLYVSPTGSTLWRFDYTFEDKRKTFSMGRYPDITLAEIRDLHLEARRKLAQGIDPSAQKKAVKAATRTSAANSFEVVAREWYAKQAPIWSGVHADRTLARLNNDLIPLLGPKDIGEVTAPDLLAVLRKIEERGANDTAHRTRGVASLVFRYAIATGRAERDPAQDLRGALAPTKVTHYASITEPKDIGHLLRHIDAYTGYHAVRIALQIAPYVFVRPTELRCAEWAEFDLESDAPTWTIPAKRMKMDRDHLVPLSRQVVELLQALHPYTGHSPYLFPSPRTSLKAISNMTLNNALSIMGYGGDRMTVHGFRSMASTLLNEQGYNKDAVERQLAHVEGNSVRKAYNKAEYLPERRKMMQEWADYLDGLKAS